MEGKDEESESMQELFAFKWLGTEWQNELGSTLLIHEQRNEGNVFIGSYQTGVARADQLPPPTPVIGSYQECEDGGFLLSFVVQWSVVREGKTRFSSCCWNGKLFKDAGSFTTTWTLVSDVEETALWNSVTTNKNTFIRVIAIS
jgi:hypothetical protein